MFSFTEKVAVPPEVPIPAPAKISPVGFSSTVKLITLVLLISSVKISSLTVLKKPNALTELTDLFAKISLKGSPSSISN